VGIDNSTQRRDFVRAHTPPGEDTCFSAEIIMFVEISGFCEGGITVPHRLHSSSKGGTVVLALIRWLSAHPDALLRDTSRRPICTSPLDINHALWKYAKSNRLLLTTNTVRKNLRYYDGSDEAQRLRNYRRESDAYFDLILPETFESYMNCTPCNELTQENSILETITIPFE